MWFGAPAGELALLAAAIVVGGVITGILAGLFGIGGGAVIVPVLYEVFRILGVPEEVRMQLCVGTSLAIIVPTTIQSYRAHRARGAVIESIIAAKLLFGRETWRLASELPSRVGMAGYGFLVGLCSALMGVSGGSVSNMILTLHGKPLHNAVATSAGLGVPITIAGTIGYMLAGLPHQALTPPLCIGFVSLLGVAVMAPVSSFTAAYGARLAHALSKRRLEIAFAVFLLAVSARFLVSLIG